MSKCPEIVAHRGSSCDRPENALSSFIAAAQSGADQIELDVHLSADNVLMVMHDETLDQTSHGKGPISALTLAELKTIRLRGIDETIPTLDEVLDSVGSVIHTRIEIKRNAKGAYAGLTDRIAEAVEKRGLKQRVTIMCFDPASLRPFAKAGYATSLSYGRIFAPSGKSLAETVKELAGEGISDVGYFFPELDAEAIAIITDAGLTVGAWTVNGASRLDYWLRAPISYLLTDQAELALELRRGL